MIQRTTRLDCTDNPMSLYDMHCHLAFMAEPDVFAHEALKAQTQVFSVSTTPDEYDRLAHSEAASQRSIHHALGLHPWWIAESAEDLASQLERFDALHSETSYIGEVGLDFSSRRIANSDNQITAFTHIVDSCVQRARITTDRPLLSIHCVRAHDEMFALLRRADCARWCTCVFHWFSGSSDQLQQAIKMGCFFSVSRAMLASKRGRAYAKAIPEDRLLLETDAPLVSDPEKRLPCVSYPFARVHEELRDTLILLAELRQCEVCHLAEAIATSSRNLLAFNQHV